MKIEKTGESWADVDRLVSEMWFLPDDPAQLAVLRERLAREVAPYADWPKWRLRRYLTKAAHWALGYKIIMIGRIDERLGRDQGLRF